jgi:hypothetical protein
MKGADAVGRAAMQASAFCAVVMDTGLPRQRTKFRVPKRRAPR